MYKKKANEWKQKKMRVASFRLDVKYFDINISINYYSVNTETL